jgi:hypothetical protein
LTARSNVTLKNNTMMMFIATNLMLWTTIITNKEGGLDDKENKN